MTIDLSLVLAVACYLFESRLVGYRDLLFSLHADEHFSKTSMMVVS